MTHTVSLVVAFVGSVMVAPLLAPLPQMAFAAEDDRLPSIEDLSVQPEVFLVSDQRKKDCTRLASVCMLARGGGTIAGVDVNPLVGIVTTLGRGTQLASAGGDTLSTPDTWHVEMIARFRAATTREPIIVAVMDYADAEGMARREATAVWQVDGPPVKDLGMRFVFSAQDGFLPRHTYLVRIVQGVGASEKVLAEGNFQLE